MKKYILTSACTLVLSLIGAFGANQNSVNSDNELSTDKTSTVVEQNVTDIEGQTDLQIEKDLQDADVASQDTNSNAGEKEVTPQTASKAEAIEVSTANQTTVTEAAAKKDTTKATVNQATTNQATTNQVKAIQTSTNQVKEVATTDNQACEKSNNNGPVLIYKNVNLSNCDTTSDVVKELQKNGYTNITNGNIQNIDSLKDILASIQNNGNNGNTSTQSTPTATPDKTTTTNNTTTNNTTTNNTTTTTKPASTNNQTTTTTTTPTTTPSSNTSSGISDYASEVLRLVNIERQKAGLSALTTNSTLQAAADQRAKETVQSFSHTRPNGTSFSTVLKEYGISYSAAGENIAYGQKSPQEVVTGWMNSSGHRANILNSNFSKIGIGVYQSNGTIYWSQLFTN